MRPRAQGSFRQVRITRILDATLEVFSEFSFEDATTGEIVRRAKISKRDLYSFFPTKQTLLMGTIVREMQRQDGSFREMIAACSSLAGLREKLELIGRTVVVDLLSPTMGVVSRLVASESIKQPFLGDLYFEGGVAQRCKLISSVLTGHRRKKAGEGSEEQKPAEYFFSSLAYFPSMMIQLGMRDQWNPEAIDLHVRSQTELFLKAHPDFG
jgi:TetR/AcrR family transcriptional repressor of mexJK operon